MVFICHDLALIQSFAHQIAVMYLGNIVEVIPGADVMEKSVHPYTQALLGAQFPFTWTRIPKSKALKVKRPVHWMYPRAVRSRTLRTLYGRMQK